MGLQNLNSTQDNAAENDINSYMAMKFLHEICEKLYQFYKPKKILEKNCFNFTKTKEILEMPILDLGSLIQ